MAFGQDVGHLYLARGKFSFTSISKAALYHGIERSDYPPVNSLLGLLLISRRS